MKSFHFLIQNSFEILMINGSDDSYNGGNEGFQLIKSLYNGPLHHYNYKLTHGPWIQSVNETGLKLSDKTIENINTTQHSSTIIDYFINVSIEKLQWY